MSKRIAQVAFSVLISLAVIVAIYTSVQGLAPKADTNSAKVHVVNGLQTNLNHFRSSAAELESAGIQADPFVQPDKGSGHGGCEDELRVNPSD